MNHVEAARTSLLHFHFMQAQLKKLLGYKCQHESKLDGNISSQQIKTAIIITMTSLNSNPHTQLKYTMCFHTHI